MSRKTANEIAAAVRQLPSLEPVVVRLLASFEDSDVDTNVLAHEVAQDQALVARVLRLANSSFYGLQARVGSLREAVMVLGFRNVRAAVVAIVVTRCFVARNVPGFDFVTFWKHSTAVGIAAREIARRCRRPEDVAFTAGLVHDIGVLALLSVAPAEMAEVLAYGRQHGCKIRDAERALLGIDHSEVGACLARQWQWPASLGDSIALHHEPDDATADSLANLVHLADVTVRALGVAGDASAAVPQVSDMVLSRLAINSDDLKGVMAVVEAELEAAYRELFD